MAGAGGNSGCSEDCTGPMAGSMMHAGRGRYYIAVQPRNVHLKMCRLEAPTELSVGCPCRKTRQAAFESPATSPSPAASLTPAASLPPAASSPPLTPLLAAVAALCRRLVFAALPPPAASSLPLLPLVAEEAARCSFAAWYARDTRELSHVWHTYLTLNSMARCLVNADRGFSSRQAAHTMLAGGGSCAGARSFSCLTARFASQLRQYECKPSTPPFRRPKAAAGSSCWQSRHSLVCGTRGMGSAAMRQASCSAQQALHCVLRPDLFRLSIAKCAAGSSCRQVRHVCGSLVGGCHARGLAAGLLRLQAESGGVG